MFRGIHHVAIIGSDYKRSRAFYTEILGFKIIRESWRTEQQSWKCDIAAGNVEIELFSFPKPPPRLTQPEAAGLRHIAFNVTDVQETVDYLLVKGITCEPIRTDPHTGKLFTFLTDPDGLPLELYQT